VAWGNTESARRYAASAQSVTRPDPEYTLAVCGTHILPLRTPRTPRSICTREDKRPDLIPLQHPSHCLGPRIALRTELDPQFDSQTRQ
jgi:hypothetical protein